MTNQLKSKKQAMQIKGMPQTVPTEMKKHQRNCSVSLGTCEADIVIGNYLGTRILSVVSIINRKEGNGDTSKLIKYLDGYARQCRCKEIWYPTVLNPKLVIMLIKRGYEPITVKDELFGEVDIFRKKFEPSNNMGNK